MRRLFSAVAFCALCALAPTVSSTDGSFVPLGDWTPREGDRLVVDTTLNRAYLIHEDTTYTSFPVATGQRRNVWYIGRYYNAATPSRTWLAQSKETKWDRVTFGEDGLFIRLFYKGEETPYGIHAYRKDEMDQTDPADRYRSMGCIVPRRADLAVIERTFEINNRSMTVVTTSSVRDPYAVAFADRTLPPMNW